MSAYNFVRSGRNFAVKISLLSSWLQRYLRSKLKVVAKRTKFCTFFALQNFKRGGAPKSCSCVNTPTYSRVKCQSFVGFTP